MKAVLPKNETARLEALRQYQILDTLPEQAFDDLTLLAARICGTPMALVSLIDSDRQWFKSSVGMTMSETARDMAFCAHAILEDQVTVVPDAIKDTRFADNPLVTSDPNIRFYGGAPLITPAGEALGTLCVLDLVPRELSEEQIQSLQALARRVMTELELRKTANALQIRNAELAREIEERRGREERLRLLESVAVNANDAVIITEAEPIDHPGPQVIYVNRAFTDQTGYGAKDIVGQTPRILQGPNTDRTVLDKIRNALSRRESIIVELLNYRKDGSEFSVEFNIAPVTDASGSVTHFVSVQRDITDRKAAEDALRESHNELERRVDERTAELSESNKLFRELNRQTELLLNSAGEGVYGLGLEGNTTFVNPAAAKMLGWKAADMLGRNMHELIHYAKPDGSPYSIAECPINESLKQESANHVDNEVFWRKDGSSFPVEYISTPILEDGKVAGVVITFNDITERRQAEEKMNYLAYYDGTTELPNRSLFEDRLSQALSLSQQNQQILAVLFLVIDHFKKVKDTLGSEIGNQLLRGVAERLVNGFGETTSVASFGGGEFSLLLPQARNASEIAETVQKIQLFFQSPFHLGGHEIFITTSVGISVYPSDGKDAESLLKNSGTALYRAREQGGNNYQFYAADMSANALRRLSLESSLRHGVEREEFAVYYQPKVEIDSGKPVGMEALVRWQHPETGMVSPAEFIPLAEETGLIVSIGEWVLRTACAQTKAWQKAGFPPLRVAVNLSPRQFQQPDLITMVRNVLEETQLDAAYLELEVTESSVMKNTNSAIATLKELKAMGIQLSIDDFGSGYSSLAYLKRFPIDFLKIDQSFIRDVIRDPNDAAIVIAIITLAHSLKLKVVAEGVESEEQLTLLRLLRCDEIQGYLFSRPLPTLAFQSLIEEGRKLRT